MSLRGAEGVLTKELRDELVLSSSVSSVSLIPLLTELLSSQLSQRERERREKREQHEKEMSDNEIQMGNDR